MYTNVFNKDGMPTCVEIRPMGKKETGRIEALNRRIKRGTAKIKLEEKEIVFKSGYKEWRINLDFDSEIKAIKNLLQRKFKMATTFSPESGILIISFKY